MYSSIINFWQILLTIIHNTGYDDRIMMIIISLGDRGHITSVKVTSQYGITMKRCSPLTHHFNLAHRSQYVELRLSFMTVNAPITLNNFDFVPN